jgi:hypothetical protein
MPPCVGNAPYNPRLPEEEADDQKQKEGYDGEDLMKQWENLFQPTATSTTTSAAASGVNDHISICNAWDGILAKAGSGRGLGPPRFVNHNSPHEEEIGTWPENDASMCSV